MRPLERAVVEERAQARPAAGGDPLETHTAQRALERPLEARRAGADEEDLARPQAQNLCERSHFAADAARTKLGA